MVAFIARIISQGRRPGAPVRGSGEADFEINFLRQDDRKFAMRKVENNALANAAEQSFDKIDFNS
jgi:hypothetical protein